MNFINNKFKYIYSFRQKYVVQKKNKIYISIILFKIVFLFFGYFYLKNNKCYQISNNFFNYSKLGFKCFKTESFTVGQLIYSIQHQYSDYFRYTSLINKRETKCGNDKKLILLIGQSNAANEVKSYLYKNNNLNLYEGRCYYLSNPVLGATGNKDNISLAISNYLEENNYIFLTLAWSGSSILDWGSDKFSYLNNEVLKQLVQQKILIF